MRKVRRGAHYELSRMGNSFFDGSREGGGFATKEIGARATAERYVTLDVSRQLRHVCGSTTSGAYASSGRTTRSGRPTLRLWTIT